MDLRKIKKLIELVEESGISELEVRSGDEAVRIARPSPQAATPQIAVSDTGVAAQRLTAEATLEVRAPMAGTFYTAPEPDAPPFVQTGGQCDAQAVVCIIESMKMMNEIRLQESGRCEQVLVRNGEPVSAQQLLFRFAPTT